MELSEFQRDCYKNSVDHGWWEGADDRIIPEKLMLIVSEISEALEVYRDGRHNEGVYYVNGKPEGFGIELSDALIRLLDLAGWMGISLDELAQTKHSYNLARSYRHGGRLA